MCRVLLTSLLYFQIGETPFYVAVDHDMKTVVISIRGTLSLQVRRAGRTAQAAVA